MSSEPIKEVIESKKHTPQEFKDRYEALCDETGYQIVVNPAWIKRDDGSYSMILQINVGEMPKS